MPTFGAARQGNFYVQTVASLVSQNIAANTSTIDIWVNFWADPGWWVDASFTTDAHVNGGQVVANTAQRRVGNGAPLGVTFASTRVTRTHNADGTLTISVGGTVKANNVIAFHQTSGGSYTLPTIPRGTTAVWAEQNPQYKDIGSTQRINLPRASSAFVHDVTAYFGTSKELIGWRQPTTFEWEIPLELLHQIPNAETGRGSLSTVTFSSGTPIATRDSSIYLRAPDHVVPKVTQTLWDDNNPVIKSAIGAFVQDLSLIKGNVTAEGVYGSTIRSTGVEVNGASVEAGATIVPRVAGTVTAYGVATDSRGRVGKQAANFEVLPYTPPTVAPNQWSVRRANAANVPTDQGNYLRVDLNAKAASLKVNGVEKNALKIRIFTRPAVGGSWVARNVITAGITHNGAIQVTGGAAFPVHNSYEVRIEIQDNTGVAPTTIITTVPTATVTLDWNGVAVGVGKYHERGAVDINGDVYASGNINTETMVIAGDFTAGTGGVMANQVISTSTVNAGPQATELDPVGSGKLWFSDTPPEGWLLCQGQEISRTNYSELFAILGTTYGVGDNATTFNLPDLRGRVPVGKSTDAEFNSLGKKFGTKTHTLTIAQMPTHSHPQQVTAPTQAGPGVRVDYVRDASSVAYTQGISTLNTGGGGAHNNIQPSIATQWIIRAR